MALFGGKKEENETKGTGSASEAKADAKAQKKEKKSKSEPKKSTSTKKSSSKKGDALVSRMHYYGVLSTPRVTEKATRVAEHNVYTFNVATDATKSEIAKAVESIFNVKPVKVRTVQVPSKKKLYRGKRGVKSGGKKAYVTLKKGDTIELV